MPPGLFLRTVSRLARGAFLSGCHTSPFLILLGNAKGEDIGGSNTAAELFIARSRGTIVAIGKQSVTLVSPSAGQNRSLSPRPW